MFVLQARSETTVVAKVGFRHVEAPVQAFSGGAVEAKSAVEYPNYKKGTRHMWRPPWFWVPLGN